MDEFHTLWADDSSLFQHLMMIGATRQGKSMLIQQRITDFGETPEQTPPEVRAAFKRLYQRRQLRREVTLAMQEGTLQTITEGEFHPDTTFFKVDDPNWTVAGEHLLTLAIVLGDEQAALNLIEQGANPLAQDKDARNPLVCLLQWKDISVSLLEKLIDLGAGFEEGAEMIIDHRNRSWVEYAARLIEKRQLGQQIPTTEQGQGLLKRL